MAAISNTDQSKTVKTDNSYLADKVGLRVKHIPKRGMVTVLDCFAGSGRIWRAVKRRTSRDIQVLAMDKKNAGYHLPGDNMTWLMSLDLSRFNVIDLDAYRIPYEQMKILFEREYHGIVFVTFIQTIYGAMPRELLRDLGFTDSMFEKANSVFNVRGWEYFLEWLAGHGVIKIIHRSHARKHYLTFTL